MSKIIISFEASEELKEALRVEAFNRKKTVSALIRELLENDIASIEKFRTIIEQLEKTKNDN